MWIGILLVCYDPMALSCSVMAKSEPFYSEEACLKEGEQITANIRQTGAYVTLNCHKVEGGNT